MLKYNKCIVAFIDLLGFKSKLNAVDSDESLRSLYENVKKVHEHFEKAPSDRSAQESQVLRGKTVLSLSDALVVSVDCESDYVGHMGLVDALASELHDLCFAQACCVTQGIFLRGGVSFGYFAIENDVLLSNAMAAAYELENQVVLPVIAIDQELFDAYCNLEGQEYYEEGTEPKNVLFKKTTNPNTGTPIIYLDYLSVAVGMSSEWYIDADRQEYIQETDSDRRHRLLSSSYKKSDERTIQWHKSAIEKELAKNHTSNVAKKYLWCRDYHNTFVKDYDYDKSLIISDQSEVMTGKE